LTYVIILLLLSAVVWLVSGPLRRGATGRSTAGGEPTLGSIQRIDLEAARDAKYREIRDAELDHQTGKLSDEDFEAIDSTLRAEAVALLHELDALELRQQAERLEPET
jgi:hypothetical protein